MLRIPCPYCGERDYVEFVYAGDASQRIPDLADSSTDQWTDFVFIRDNLMGDHEEYWQHQNGCREWLRVVRNTVTHKIVSVQSAREVSASRNAEEVKSA